MNDGKQMCCLCLSPDDSSSPFIYLVSKGEDNCSYIDKLSSSLFKLANILNENSCDDYMICGKCSDTIKMIHKFNRNCLQNVRKYNTYREALKLEILANEQYRDAKDLVKEFQVKKEVVEVSISTGVSHRAVEIDVTRIKKEFPHKTETIFFGNKARKAEFKGEEKMTADTTSSHNEPDVFEPNCELQVKGEDNLDLAAFEKTNAEGNSRQTFSRNVQGYNKMEKRHICILCRKNFSTKSYLEKHMRIHAGVKPFTCDVCDTSFRMKAHLNRHMLIHTGEKPYGCEVCSKAFCTKQNLIQHMLIHSGEKPYVCDMCGKRCSDKSNLVKHKRIHTGHKPYTCDVCGRSFTINQHLTNHKRMHTGEKPFACHMCSKSFTVKSSLKQHLRTQHNLE